MADVKIGTFMETEDSDGGLSYMQGQLIFK